MSNDKTDFKSGFIALVGRPNAGKSTLLNELLDQKLAIITNKPQTTRNVIKGIRTDDDSQLIFLDTPGIHKPRHKLGGAMVKNTYSSFSDADIIYHVIDGTQKFGPGDQFILKKLEALDKPVFLVINKVDILDKDLLIEIIVEWKDHFDYKEIVPISALRDDNVERLVSVTKEYLPDDLQYYPEDITTDQDPEFLIGEIVREKLINQMEEEIPHSLAVVIDEYEKKENVHLIDAVVIVERESQKGIVIGKGGHVLKEVGTQARKDLEHILKGKVYLSLHVKVEKDWRNRPLKVEKFGYKGDL